MKNKLNLPGDKEVKYILLLVSGMVLTGLIMLAVYVTG